MIYGKKIVESVEHNEEKNTIEIVYREPSQVILASNPPQRAPDLVYKHIYGVSENGTIYIMKKVVGTHVPAKSLAEEIKFDE